MLTRITLPVPLPSDWPAGTTIQVFWDNLTGTVDYADPLLARELKLFRYEPATVPLYERGDLYGPDLYTGGPSAPGDLYKCPSLYDEAALYDPLPYVYFDVMVPAAHGVAKFGVRATDPSGNVQTDTIVEVQVFVSSPVPKDVDELLYSSYDGVNDHVVFTYTITTE